MKSLREHFKSLREHLNESLLNEALKMTVQTAYLGDLDETEGTKAACKEVKFRYEQMLTSLFPSNTISLKVTPPGKELSDHYYNVDATLKSNEDIINWHALICCLENYSFDEYKEFIDDKKLLNYLSQNLEELNTVIDSIRIGELNRKFTNLRDKYFTIE